ncbi:MAG: hypothetical protein RQ982_01105 [Gammaproteobacteria bacterium]|nr:hypothetical protein [Gammaproteobacteria bacterium]
MKLYKHNDTVLNAEDKFSRHRGASAVPTDLTQLGELAIRLLNDKNLEVSKVRPFFWSLVEAYVDRFHLYPFDINKALFSYLELGDYSEETVLDLVMKLESQFEKVHGRPLRKSSQLFQYRDGLDDEISDLRDSIKYAVMVGEIK